MRQHVDHDEPAAWPEDAVSFRNYRFGLRNVVKHQGKYREIERFVLHRQPLEVAVAHIDVRLIRKTPGSGSITNSTFSSNTIGVAVVANSGSLEADGLQLLHAGTLRHVLHRAGLITFAG